MIYINLLNGKVSQRPIIRYEVFCKVTASRPLSVTNPKPPLYPAPDTLQPPSRFPELMERLLGKSPLRLVVSRSPLENAKNIWEETLECGHVTHTFVDFFWDEKQHLILSQPSAKRRRCHPCRDVLAAAAPSPKKPCASTKRERRKAS